MIPIDRLNRLQSFKLIFAVGLIHFNFSMTTAAIINIRQSRKWYRIDGERTRLLKLSNEKDEVKSDGGDEENRFVSSSLSFCWCL